MKFIEDNQKDPVWSLSEAKNKFSEVVNLALHKGPQTIRRRKDRVVVMDEKRYKKLCGKKKSFIDFLLSAPGGLQDLDLSRDQSPMREVSL